ncbi:MAG: PqqD family protein [Thermomicrobiales bacterium]
MTSAFESDEMSGEMATRFPKKGEQVRDELLQDGGMILYHVTANQLTTLNPTAALVWEYCDGAHDFAMIAAEIRDIFPDVPTVEADVAAILRDLYARGLLRSDEG